MGDADRSLMMPGNEAHGCVWATAILWRCEIAKRGDVPRMDVRATLSMTIPKADIQKGCPMPGDVPMGDVDCSLTATGAEMQRCAGATAIQ